MLISILSLNLKLLNLSILFMGFTTTANIVLTNAMALKIVGEKRFVNACNILTLNFALFQALFSFIFVYMLDFVSMFEIFIFCALALGLSTLLLLPINN